MAASARFNIITDPINKLSEMREIELGAVSHVRWMQGSKAFNLVSQGGRNYLVNEDVGSIINKFQVAGIETIVLEDAEKDDEPMIIPTHQIVRQKWDGRFTTIRVGISEPRELLARNNPLNLKIEP